MENVPLLGQETANFSHSTGCTAIACIQHMEMGTDVLVQAKGQNNAQGPSNEDLWAPLGKQEQRKCPSAYKCDIITLNSCLIWLQQNWYRVKLGPKLIQSLRPL